ncbi:MAG: protein kinase [Acidobacteria bacterium]|nr:protein kinase [Acidobacteriota bacterium]
MRPQEDAAFGPARYRMGELLGEGAMGQVYKAQDLELNRTVAIKFLRSETPETLRKLRKEAQAQARVDHPNICKVYEVAELEGRPYIAMQYVDGKSLDVVGEGMMLEEKVRVLRDVAEAAHAAHRTGLIHRDLKPGNILVEGSSQEGLFPYVTDFGLARDPDAADVTRTGMLVGTPAYMAPEQVRGDVRSFDRRTDVYGLGATLYELLTGSRPFEAESGIGAMMRVLHDDPEPPRKKNPRIPPDLEKVVLKCLAKEPGGRYESARALAEDLNRFLDGEPVLAKPAGPLGRLFRKVRRHKAVTAMLSIAILAALVSGLLGLYSRRTALRRAAFAQQFGQEVEKTESLLRYAYMLPLHSAEPERNMVRKRIARIEEKISGAGHAAVGPGQYAIGRGYLALVDYDRALEHLEAAWTSEYRTPETAYALGLVMGALYQRELKKAERIEDQQQREVRRKELRRQYGDAALGYLKLSAGTQAETPEYAEGLIAFYEGRYEEAHGLARKAAGRVPWMYEARYLEGDILTARAFEKRRKGDYKGALVDLASAESAILDGIRIGQSDPRGYGALCDLRVEIAATVHGGGGGEIRETVDKAISASDEALVADPTMVAAHRAKTRAFTLWIDYQLGHGMDPSETLTLAERSATRAIELDPRKAEASAELGEVYYHQSVNAWLQGQDPFPFIDASIKAASQAVRMEPGSAEMLSTLGWKWMSKGTYQMERGMDPRESFRHAIECQTGATGRDPNVHSHWDSLGMASRLLGKYEMEHGQDPGSSFKQAIDAFGKAIKINAANPSVYSNLGNVFLNLAAYQMGIGVDVRPTLDSAIQNYSKAIQLNPSIPLPHANCGTAYVQLAEYDLQAGRDPRKNLELARSHLRDSSLISTYSTVLARMGRTYVVEAAYEMKHRRPFNSAARGRKSLQDALSKNPNEAEAHREMGKLELLQARWQIQSSKGPGPFFGRSRQALTAAIAIDPDADNYATLADAYRWEVQWRPALSDVKSGLDMAEKALSLNPNLAAAHAIRGSLLRAQSRLTGNATAEQDARESIRRAWDLNPRLGEDYEAPAEPLPRPR